MRSHCACTHRWRSEESRPSSVLARTVECDSPFQGLLAGHLGRPAKLSPDTLGVRDESAGVPGAFTPVNQRRTRPGQLQDLLSEVAHEHARATAQVQAMAAIHLGRHEMGPGDVLDEHVVTQLIATPVEHQWLIAERCLYP